MFSSAGRLPSTMHHNFATVPQANIPRSVFNRSHGLKATIGAPFDTDESKLYPIFVDEALPGDTFNLKVTTFARLATPIVPIMDNLYCDIHFFAVPYRLVWANWQKFMGEQIDPGDSTDFEIPMMTSTAVNGYGNGTIYDYMGLPTKVPGYEHSALWFRAYNLIWNQWYRDENLQTSVDVPTDDGGASDTAAQYQLLPRGKRHDYFTSCLPFAQKGDPVSIPISSNPAPVFSKDETIKVKPGWAGAERTVTMGSVSGANILSYAGADGSGAEMRWGSQTGLLADLSAVAGATINSLRQAFQIQKLYERDARGGTRYIEILRSHFGVISPDARLQRPEFLGGGSTPIQFTPVPQTNGTGATGTPQGNLAAFATMSHRGVGFTKSFTEHCLILGLLSIRADQTYQYGLDRMWSRTTRWDFYWPALAHLGEQAVLKKEIYCVGTGGSSDATAFGYQERFAEYRYKQNKVAGKFRSNDAASLDLWHLAQELSGVPNLDATFITERPPLSRVIAVQDEPALLLDAYFDFKAARPMPTYSVPGLIDHF